MTSGSARSVAANGERDSYPDPGRTRATSPVASRPTTGSALPPTASASRPERLIFTAPPQPPDRRQRACTRQGESLNALSRR